MQLPFSPDEAVVGGGLGGLAAATYRARAGAKVVLFEKASHLGGRAMSEIREGGVPNLGAHALYVGGPGRQVLSELGVPWTGRDPAHCLQTWARIGGVRKALPSTPGSLLTSSFLELQGKYELAKTLTWLSAASVSESLDSQTLEQWLAGLKSQTARKLLRTLGHVSAYASSPEHISAGAVLRQLKRALKGVRYLDGGWQTLVDGLRAAALAAGVEIVHARVDAIEQAQGSVTGIRLADGSTVPVNAAIVCASPEVAAELTRVESLRGFAAAARPVRASCLDLILSELPNPHCHSCFDMDEPLYFSVHSQVARLMQGPGHLIHTLKYLDPFETHDPATTREELEAYLDDLQPGWRKNVVHARYLPNMVVHNALPQAATHGLSARPSATVASVRGLGVAGDWVGQGGMLLDAVLASAKDAAVGLSRQNVTSRVA